MTEAHQPNPWGDFIVHAVYTSGEAEPAPPGYWLNVEWSLPDGSPVPPGFFEVPPSGRVPYRGEVHATPRETGSFDQES